MKVCLYDFVNDCECEEICDKYKGIEVGFFEVSKRIDLASLMKTLTRFSDKYNQERKGKIRQQIDNEAREYMRVICGEDIRGVYSVYEAMKEGLISYGR